MTFFVYPILISLIKNTWTGSGDTFMIKTFKKLHKEQEQYFWDKTE